MGILTFQFSFERDRKAKINRIVGAQPEVSIRKSINRRAHGALSLVLSDIYLNLGLNAC
jgi:hypothetical protein